MSENIFSDEEVSIFKQLNGFDSIFWAFEILMKNGNENMLKDINDRNVNVLLEASKATGDKRNCILMKHAVQLLTECRDQ